WSETSIVLSLTPPAAPARSERPKRNGLAIGCFVLGMVAIIGWVAYRTGESAQAKIDPPHPPANVPVTVSPPPPQVLKKSEEIQINSEPFGAQIYDGPKLLGVAPLNVPVSDSGVLLTLVRSGFAELKYLVKPVDGPSVTLRLSPDRRRDPRARVTGSTKAK